MKILSKEDFLNIIYSVKNDPEVYKNIGYPGVYNDGCGHTYPCKIFNKVTTIKGTYANIFINNGTKVQYLAVPIDTIEETENE
jgi:hypothetical protein